MTIEPLRRDIPLGEGEGPSPVRLHSAGNLPICVDLDGTLIRTDSLQESAVAAVFGNWMTLLRLPGWLGRGRAALKQELAARWRFDPAQLPYNDALVSLLRTEKARGRRIVLTTAADHRIAAAIAEHLGVFDDIIASDGIRNLRGALETAIQAADLWRAN